MKNLLNLGKTLNKAEQQAINGGNDGRECRNHRDCGCVRTPCVNGLQYRPVCAPWGTCVWGNFPCQNC